MGIYAIADLHLSLSSNKSMEKFAGWENYVHRIQENWSKVVMPEDTVVLPGDVSWGMSLQESLEDFRFLDNLPGEKLLCKGNHDYWWTSKSKMEQFFEENGLTTLKILHNNCIVRQGLILCGSRGWLFENGEPHDQKILAREAGRLSLSLSAANGLEGERIAFLHYPPVFGTEVSPEILDVLHQFQVKRCYYGHIHGYGHNLALNGMYDGIDFRLVSADYLKFSPLKVVNED